MQESFRTYIHHGSDLSVWALVSQFRLKSASPQCLWQALEASLPPSERKVGILSGCHFLTHMVIQSIALSRNKRVSFLPYQIFVEQKPPWHVLVYRPCLFLPSDYRHHTRFVIPPPPPSQAQHAEVPGPGSKPTPQQRPSRIRKPAAAPGNASVFVILKAILVSSLKW